MKGPFVGRESFEDMKAQRDAIQVRYDTLLAQYHSLRLEGANLPYPKAERSAPIDLVAQASIKRSFGNRALRKQYAELAALRRSEGIPEAEIAAEIERGESDFDAAVATMEHPDETPVKTAQSAIGSVSVV